MVPICGRFHFSQTVSVFNHRQHATAGGVARMVVAPFDLVKIRFQIQVGAPASPFPTLRNGIPALPQRTAAPPSIDSLQYRGILQTVRHIVRNEGVLVRCGRVWSHSTHFFRGVFKHRVDFAPSQAQAFWKGTWAAQILSMIYSSVQFTTYHSIHPAILVQLCLRHYQWHIVMYLVRCFRITYSCLVSSNRSRLHS